MVLIDGKKVSAEVRACLAKEAKELKEKTGRVPGLATVLVGDDPASAFGRQVTDPQSFCQAADAANVGLGYVDLADVHQVDEFEAGVLPFARGDRYRRFIVQPGVAGEIIDLQGRLDEVDVEVSPVLEGVESALDIVPCVLDVDHEDEVRANGLAAGGDDLGDFFIGFVHAAVVVGAEQGDLELGGTEADVAGAQHPFHE